MCVCVVCVCVCGMCVCVVCVCVCGMCVCGVWCVCMWCVCVVCVCVTRVFVCGARVCCVMCVYVVCVVCGMCVCVCVAHIFGQNVLRIPLFLYDARPVYFPAFLSYCLDSALFLVLYIAVNCVTTAQCPEHIKDCSVSLKRTYLEVFSRTGVMEWSPQRRIIVRSGEPNC